MSRHVFLVTFSLLASAGSLPAQQAAPGAAPPAAPAPANQASTPTEDVKVGDRWIYEVRDEITGEVKATITHVVTDITKSDINIRVSASGGPNPGYITYDRFWNVKDNGTWKFTPNDGTGIRLPLETGKTWSFQSNDVNSRQGFSSKRSGRVKVVGQESITTSAGTFETFKIEETTTLTSSNDPIKKVQVTQQTWYAPEVNHWVKRMYVSKADGRVRENNSVELVEYGHR